MAKEKKKPAKTEEPTVTEEQAAENTAEEKAEATAAEQEKSEAKDETAALKKELEAAKDSLLRTVAEYDNFRKRSQKEKEAVYGDTKAEVIGKLLPVLDNFSRAATSEGDLESYKKGVEMIYKQLTDTFASLGVTEFGEKGETFDPNIHNGVMHVDDEELGENVIAEVFMKGYMLGDRVVRHATVKVAN